MQQPKITVLCTVYNGAKYLDRAVPSILEQSYRNFEFLIINDGSTDETHNFLAKISKEDSRVRVLNPGRLGRINALNFGIEQATTELVAIQDFDDISFRDRLEKQVAFMDSNPTIVWSCGAYILKNASRNETYTVFPPTNHSEIIKHFAHSIPFAHTLVMVRKSIIQEVGGYPPISDSLEDLRLCLRLAQKGYQIANICDVIGIHHAHSESFWNANFKYQERQKSIRQLQLEAIKTLKLPFWMYIYPLGRYIYSILPTSLKRFLRRSVIGVKEVETKI